MHCDIFNNRYNAVLIDDIIIFGQIKTCMARWGCMFVAIVLQKVVTLCCVVKNQIIEQLFDVGVIILIIVVVMIIVNIVIVVTTVVLIN